MAIANLFCEMAYDFYSSPSAYRVQKTLKQALTFKGIGLHTGVKAEIRLIPAPPNHGIVFERTDLKKPVRVFAHYDAVVDTTMATSLGYRDWKEARIGTVEHLMAALYGMGITNLLIEVSGPEIPILDGSAGPYLEAFWDVGLELQPFSLSDSENSETDQDLSRTALSASFCRGRGCA